MVVIIHWHLFLIYWNVVYFVLDLAGQVTLAIIYQTECLFSQGKCKGVWHPGQNFDLATPPPPQLTSKNEYCALVLIRILHFIISDLVHTINMELVVTVLHFTQNMDWKKYTLVFKICETKCEEKMLNRSETEPVSIRPVVVSIHMAICLPEHVLTRHTVHYTIARYQVLLVVHWRPWGLTHSFFSSVMYFYF